MVFFGVVAQVRAGGDPPFQQLQRQRDAVGYETFTAGDYKPGLVKHIVLFRYGHNVTSAQRAEVMRRFLLLRNTTRRGGLTVSVK